MAAFRWLQSLLFKVKLDVLYLNDFRIPAQTDFCSEDASEEESPMVVSALSMRLGILKLLQLFARGDRKWMLPLRLVLGLLGFILVVLQSLEHCPFCLYGVLDDGFGDGWSTGRRHIRQERLPVFFSWRGSNSGL